MGVQRTRAKSTNQPLQKLPPLFLVAIEDGKKKCFADAGDTLTFMQRNGFNFFLHP